MTKLTPHQMTVARQMADDAIHSAKLYKDTMAVSLAELAIVAREAPTASVRRMLLLIVKERKRGRLTVERFVKILRAARP